MDINKGFIEEKAMSGKLKITEKIEGGDTTESDTPENSKIKKYLNHHWDKWIQKYENNSTFLKERRNKYV